MLEICIGGKMIHQVHFKNTQKHKDLTLNFIEGLNVITGSTDSGKTSLLRGLLFALNIFSYPFTYPFICIFQSKM